MLGERNFHEQGGWQGGRKVEKVKHTHGLDSFLNGIFYNTPPLFFEVSHFI